MIEHKMPWVLGLIAVLGLFQIGRLLVRRLRPRMTKKDKRRGLGTYRGRRLPGQLNGSEGHVFKIDNEWWIVEDGRLTKHK